MNRRSAGNPGPLEPGEVLRLGVRYVDVSVAGIDRHVEVDRADVREVGGFVERGCVDFEDVEVR